VARVAGLDVVADADAVRRRAGWVPQERAVDPLLTARENLRFAAGLYHLPARQAETRASELLALVGLESDADRLVRGFSGGMRRRLELAMGLVHDPSVLFLDEPTLGLDVAARMTVWQHIEQIRRSGRTILLTTHYLDEADSLCDRVAIVDSGRINAVGTPMELKRAYGQDTLCVELAQPVAELAASVGTHPEVSAVRADGCAMEVDVTDLVAVTRFVLDECGRLRVDARDLWGRRASLDQVFLNLTGRVLSQADD
jgi:ABC-2 type transport system ATP-binding protein